MHNDPSRRSATPFQKTSLKTSRRATLIETLETRSLLAVTWSAYAQLIGQDTAASTYSTLAGKGQTIAMIDTGIDYNVASLGGGFGAGKKVIAGYDFYSNDSDPMDTDGHGTETAGMVAANRFTFDGTTYQGIAPDAKLVALRVGTENNITDARIDQALQWVVKNYKTYGITVVNLSLGSGDYSTSKIADATLGDDFAQLKKLGIFVVAASGNDGQTNGGTIAYPAADPNVFAAGSINSTGQISDFTQRDKQLDILAPGEQVVSTKMGGGYAAVDGTSFSSPLIAGVVALLREAAPDLGVDDIASVIRTSSTTTYDGDGDGGQTTGEVYGELNLIAAISLAQTTDKNDTLDSIASSKSTSIDSMYDGSGILHLAYYDASSGKLMYAARTSGGKWTVPVVVDRSKDNVGSQLSLALDQTGKPSIAYYDSTTADLRYAWYTGTKWSESTIDSNKNVGEAPSLVFDDAGEPRISYYKKNGGDLKLASFSRTTGLWSRETIDSTDDVGADSSIAYNMASDGSETVAIAYVDRTTGNLNYWRDSSSTEEGGGVYTAVVDDLDGVNNVDLSLDGGIARIAYQDAKNADVKMAYKATTFYTLSVATAGSTGQSVSSYIDANGDYHIVYYNKTKRATYDALVTTPVTTQGTLTTPAALSGTTRIGTSGQIGTVAYDDNGDATLIGLNRTGKSLGAEDLT